MNKPVINNKTTHRAAKPENPIIASTIPYNSFTVIFWYLTPLNSI